MCPLRGAAVDKCDCDKLDFVAAKELNKEGLTRFVQDRTVIAALNDRLVRLIELVRTNTVSAPSDTSALHVPSAVKQWIRIQTQTAQTCSDFMPFRLIVSRSRTSLWNGRLRNWRRS